MTKTKLKPQIFRNTNRCKIKPEMDNSKSSLPPNLQTFKQKLLSRNGFLVFK